MQKSVSRCHYGPLLLENLREVALGFHNVLCVHCGPPGHAVGINGALGVEECQHHLFCPCCMNFGLDKPDSPFFSHCFDCCFISGVETTLPTYPSSQWTPTLPLSGGGSLPRTLTHQNSFHLHLVHEQFRHPSCWFYLQVQILVKSIVNCVFWYMMGQSKFPHIHTLIFLDVGGDISDKRWIPNLTPAIHLPLIIGWLAHLNILDDGINLHLLQALVARHHCHCFLNVFEAFSGSGKSCNKVA